LAAQLAEEFPSAVKAAKEISREISTISRGTPHNISQGYSADRTSLMRCGGVSA
jgi:hypothetical protein